ncbi:glycosyltransferase family 69 protein [Aspergillus undulatus]|uniref:glycosyltransferase family 69 protein n=1 Tax=Aspergillus undulatus TaxID=1810928 RepID=UPI003CCD4308
MHVSDTCKSAIHGLSFMFVSFIRHLSRYPKLRRRILQLFLLVFVLWSTVDIFLIHRHFHEEQTHLDYRPPDRQRIFIASALWNNERTLPTKWNEVLVELANVFGSDNIYVSIYETGSSQGTKDTLRSLDKTLGGIGVQRSILISDSSTSDEALKHPAADPKRISHLAGLRNKALQPLYDLRDSSTFFDRILFLGDVIFTKDDVLGLLNTNYGAYTAACSFDILKPPSESDALALRDAEDHEPVMQKWPFFRSSRSREAMKYMLPVPVSSCWDGMVFMSTEAIYSTHPVQFRSLPDGLTSKHLVASDTCLIHADNIISKRRGVYLNPFVRVGYNEPSYSATHSTSHWLSTWGILESVWENRLRRWFSSPFFRRWSIRSRFADWEGEDENHKDRGGFCVVDEVQSQGT